MRKPIKSFDDLKDGDKIICSIDNLVAAIFTNKYGRYLDTGNLLYDIDQFDAADWYLYDGNMIAGEYDTEYLK